MAMTETQRVALGRAVEAGRIKRGWSKEVAARKADVSSITWKRAEDGLAIQDVKLRAIETALGWPQGGALRVARGENPRQDVVDLASIPSDELLAEVRRRMGGNDAPVRVFDAPSDEQAKMYGEIVDEHEKREKQVREQPTRRR